MLPGNPAYLTSPHSPLLPCLTLLCLSLSLSLHCLSFVRFSASHYTEKRGTTRRQCPGTPITLSAHLPVSCLYLCPPSGPGDELSCSKCQLPSGLHSVPFLFACIAPKILCCLRLFLKSSVLPFLLHYSHYVPLRLAPLPAARFPLTLFCFAASSGLRLILSYLTCALHLLSPSLLFP